MVVGFKLWYADGSKHVVPVFGREHDVVQAQVDALPDRGLQVLMIYSDEFSTLTCRRCLKKDRPLLPEHAHHRERFFAMNPNMSRATEVTYRHVANQPWNRDRICIVCGDHMHYDQGIRYRRMVEGRDYYFIQFDTTAPPQMRDWMFGQTDKAEDLAHYPAAKVLYGALISDSFFKAIQQQAMHDYSLSEFGLAPVVGTIDK